VPASDYLIDDTWNVVGLAGTGSKTLQLKDVFVPEHRVLTFLETTSGKTPGASLYSENPTFSIPMLCNIPSCLASVAVGTAAGALEAYLEATSKRGPRGAVAGSNNRMAEFPTIQLRVAEAAACLTLSKPTYPGSGSSRRAAKNQVALVALILSVTGSLVEAGLVFVLGGWCDIGTERWPCRPRSLFCRGL